MGRGGLGVVLIFLYLLVVNSAVATETNTNGVVLPQTEFFVEGATPPVIEKRDIVVPSREDRRDLYEAPSIKSVELLEKEAKKELSEGIRSKIISLFSYGINDILSFSIIGLSQIPVDPISLSTVIKYNRFKRPDVVFYYNVPTILRNTSKDTDLASVSVSISSSYIFWSTVVEFFEEFRGLWNNPTYLDEKNRNISFDSELRYKIDRDSNLDARIVLDHHYDVVRRRDFLSLHTSVNDLLLAVGYRYGLERFNFFGVDFEIGAKVLEFTDREEIVSGVNGKVSFSFAFPIYANTWFLGTEGGIIPDTFLPMEWVLRLDLGYKPGENFIVYFSVFKDYEKFGSKFLSRGLNLVNRVLPGDSVMGVELSSKLFFWGNNSFSLSGGYSYYLTKVYDRYEGDIYFVEVTNASEVYSKVEVDVISLDWLNFEGIYVFSLFVPFLPYTSLHSLEANAKLLLGNFSFSLGMVGETAKRSEFGQEDIAPYLGVSVELEWEVVKNVSFILKVENALNNLIVMRKDSIISEPFCALGCVKVKL
ncbi:MAG: hypothetical protein ABDH28_01115 [Brevinematia bacterium]